MMKCNNKVLTFGLATIIGTSGLLVPFNNPVHAATLDEKKQDIESKQSDVTTNIDKKESEISKLEAEEAKLDNEIKTLDNQVADTNGKIREKEASIEDIKNNIEELKVEIETVRARIEERSLLLEDRARSLQESGGMISYMDVLLGAQDFGDFVGRINAVTTIVEADRDILQAHEADKKLLEKAEQDLNSQLQNLEDSLTELEVLKEQLDVQKNKKKVIMEQVMAQHDEAIEEVHVLENEAEFLAEQKKAIELEEKRQKEAAEAAAREAAAEAKKQAAAQAAAEKANRQAATSSSSKSKATTSSKSSTSSSSNASNSSSQKPSVTGGSFMWPASGSYTSGYGYRIHPITGARKLHGGIDIANSSDVPIVASAGGTVIRSHHSSSYGNVVYISHNINGQVYTTLYAHMETRHVSAGQAVSKGQQIGIMGNTGHSTGQHLHFEIHKGPWNGSANTVDPRSYLP